MARSLGSVDDVPSVAQKIRVTVGVALTLAAFVFAAVGLTLVLQQPSSFNLVPGTTFHSGFHRDAIVWTVVGLVLVPVAVALWLPPVRRAKKAMPRWTLVVGLLLTPFAVVVPVFFSVAAINSLGEDVYVSHSPVTGPTTTTTSPFANCDPSRQPCRVPIFEIKVHTVAQGWPIEGSEAIALVLGMGLIAWGWWWARREPERSETEP